MRRWRLPAGLLASLALGAGVAQAQGVVTSPAPASVDVTVYRNPSRSAAQELDLDWLGGFALVSETRTITLPAGESEIRFEGVAGGIVPQSAIVTGFPEGIVERNRDAYLLSPGTLLERSLGRRVTVRRTSRRTGEVREEEAVIRSGAEGAVVLQTAAGFEALRCTGLNETIVYPEVPPGLSSRPTLSVRARSAQPVTATVTLSYLAQGFDWQANYIADLSPDGRTVQLFAWLTLASSDETSFRDADVQAVAGRLNRERVEVQEAEASPLSLRCWPSARTSDVGMLDDPRANGRGPPPPPAMMSPTAVTSVSEEEMSIVVTGSRIARPEELGDLKLFRLPEPVTVAANSQKQVALLVQPRVAVETVFRSRLDPSSTEESQATMRYLVTRNRTAEGLGITLPAGGISLFTRAGGRRLLIGQGSVADRAIGDDVEIQLGESSGVRTTVSEGDFGDDWTDYTLTVTNDQTRPVRFEVEFSLDDDERFDRRSAPRQRRDGRPLWTTTVPANGTAIYRYRLLEIEPED
ncbi:hypothetical protein [Sphingosinicella sp. YJ22]|uniref:DUF4139 domain-containing protein n=1 Tax=Sphingosinicella sp. YJ22 TaxID=1104780 RepID=UPI0014072699|nr:hypothetical protein [Sphingosinicella sp. YJ22]